MTWRRDLVISILMFVARLIEEDDEIKVQLRELATHITYSERVDTPFSENLK